MQRCLSIGRRATKPALVTAGVLLSTYELLKQSLMQSGRLEEALAKVTSSKIGIHEGTVNSRSELLRRLKRYRMLFGIVNTSRESQILARLEHAIEDMETDVSTGALRKQPFCVVLYGEPGVGKSSFSIQLAKKLMHGRYGRFTSHDMVTLNETDEYQSEFRTSHKVVLFDDIGAAKLDRPDTANPWRKVIDFVNNVQKTALNPNCEMKGKVYIQPDLVILTTNLDLSGTFAQVGGFMNCPEAIARRCSSVIHLKDYHTGVVINYDGGNTHSTAYCGKMPANLKYGSETVITREAIVTQLDEQFREHMIDQQNFIDKFNSYFDDLPTINEVFDEQSEIYELQAAIAPRCDPLCEERRLNYLIANIDWDYYFCAYPEGHYSDVYYFDGYIYDAFGSHPDQAFYIHKDYMNELRQKMLDITPRPYREEEVMDIPGLIAEGNTISIKAESDTCIVSDFLNDAFVDSESLEVIPSEDTLYQSKHWGARITISPYMRSFVCEYHPMFCILVEFTAKFIVCQTDADKLNSLAADYDLPHIDKEHLLKLTNKCNSSFLKIGNQKVLINRFVPYLASHRKNQPPINSHVMACFISGVPELRRGDAFRRAFYDSTLNVFKQDHDLVHQFGANGKEVRRDLPITPPNSNASISSSDLSMSSGISSSSEEFSSSIAYFDDISTDTPPESVTGDDHYRALLSGKAKRESYHSDPSTPDYKSQTEDQQCDEFLRILNFPKLCSSRIHRNFNFAPFGEIDLVIEHEDCILVVEMKRSKDKTLIAKANRQADKYGEMISILRPNTRVFGITYTYSGIHIRYDNGRPFKSNVCDDLFLILGYTKLA